MKGICHVVKLMTGDSMEAFIMNREEVDDLQAPPADLPGAGGHFLKFVACLQEH